MVYLKIYFVCLLFICVSLSLKHVCFGYVYSQAFLVHALLVGCDWKPH